MIALTQLWVELGIGEGMEKTHVRVHTHTDTHTQQLDSPTRVPDLPLDDVTLGNRLPLCTSSPFARQECILHRVFADL